MCEHTIMVARYTRTTTTGLLTVDAWDACHICAAAKYAGFECHGLVWEHVARMHVWIFDVKWIINPQEFNSFLFRIFFRLISGNCRTVFGTMLFYFFFAIHNQMLCMQMFLTIFPKAKLPLFSIKNIQREFIAPRTITLQAANVAGASAAVITTTHLMTPQSDSLVFLQFHNISRMPFFFCWCCCCCQSFFLCRQLNWHCVRALCVCVCIPITSASLALALCPRSAHSTSFRNRIKFPLYCHTSIRCRLHDYCYHHHQRHLFRLVPPACHRSAVCTTHNTATNIYGIWYACI